MNYYEYFKDDLEKLDIIKAYVFANSLKCLPPEKREEVIHKIFSKECKPSSVEPPEKAKKFFKEERENRQLKKELDAITEEFTRSKKQPKYIEIIQKIIKSYNKSKLQSEESEKIKDELKNIFRDWKWIHGTIFSEKFDRCESLKDFENVIYNFEKWWEDIKKAMGDENEYV